MTPQDQSIPCICGNSDCTIPFGFCHCDCGEKTAIARANCSAYKWKAGFPKKYIRGHWINKKTVIGCVCGKIGCNIPFGFCHCGCGQKTEIAKSTSRKYKTRPGYPNVYCSGHVTRLNPDDVCVCGNRNCTILYGFCHCRCGEKTGIAKQSNSKFRLRNGEPFMFLPYHRRNCPIMEDALPFKINGVYCRLIPLTRGLYTIVTASDYEWLMQWKWFALKRKGHGFYAYRTDFRASDGTRTPIPMHRLILGLAQDDPHVGDHINRNSLDNRRDNLRPATISQNQMNKVMSTTTSGRKGVTWSKQRKTWVARICANRMMLDLGSSDSFKEACRLREEGERIYHGQFACSG